MPTKKPAQSKREKSAQSAVKNASTTRKTPRARKATAIYAPRHIFGWQADEVSKHLSGVRHKGSPSRLDRMARLARIVLFSDSSGKDGGRAEVRKLLRADLRPYQLEAIEKSDSQFLQGRRGPIWVLRVEPRAEQERVDEMGRSPFARAQALAAQTVGPVLKQAAQLKLRSVQIDFLGTAADVELGFFVGWESGRYRYVEARRSRPATSSPAALELHVTRASQDFGPELLSEAKALAEGVVLARHLTNLPGSDLNPKSFADAVVNHFAEFEGVSSEVWEGEKLITERCGLLQAVGGAAAEGPRLVRLRYRPANPSRSRPVALVGKGITFDSGGLDIKPSSGMRLMKKDMGGSAAVVGVLHWAATSGLDVPLDIYLALAENAIGPSAFRPGDIITARNGLQIEIHNTDAEGRLVLADALDVAVEAEPSHVVNVATLTGAIKIALGAEVAGLFANNDELAQGLHESGLATGDLNWRMPLFPPYRALLKSPFADHVNASDGFAGAITAALFLELFVKKTPWAHLDIYAWRDGVGGAQSEPGGSGQGVLCLSHWLSNLGSDIVDQDHE